MTPLAQEAILDHVAAIKRLCDEKFREGYDAGWAAAMASMKRERQEFGERLNACRTGEEFGERLAGREQPQGVTNG